VTDAASDRETRRAIDGIGGGVPRIVFDDPGAAGRDVGTALREVDLPG